MRRCVQAVDRRCRCLVQSVAVASKSDLRALTDVHKLSIWMMKVCLCVYFISD